MLDSVVGTWSAATTNFVSFVGSLDETSWSRESPCPGWTIADLVAHTIDLESMLAADPRPDHSPNWDELPHVASDFSRLTEVGVDYRRGRSQDELISELQSAHERALARIDLLGSEASIPWLRGDTPISVLLGMRTFDIWTHEQDARQVVEMPGNLDGPGALNALQYLTAGLPKIWGKSVGAPAGSTVHVSITEPGVSGEYWVQVGQDGKAGFVDQADATCSVTVPWASFVMLAGGRQPHAKFATNAVVGGDATLGRAFVKQMAVTP